MTNKLTIAPDQSAYAVDVGNDLLRVQNDGAAGLFSRNLFNNANRVAAQWICTAEDYEYLAQCNRASQAEGGTVFRIDLLLDNTDTLTEYVAQFVPGTFSLSSVQGDTFYVSATLEIKPQDYDVVNKPFVVDSSLADRSLRATLGTFVITGRDSSLRFSATHIRHATGYFSILGQATNRLIAKFLVAANGTFVLTGETSKLVRQNIPFLLANALFSFSGQSATIRKIGSYSLTAGQGSFSLTGEAAGINKVSRVNAAQGSFTLTGEAVTLTYVSVSDPNWTSVVLRLPFDGTNGATTTTDLSPTPKTMSFQGGAALSTANKKWGTAEFLGNASNFALTAGVAADFKFIHDGSTAWTMELWLRLAGFGTTSTIFDTAAGSSANAGVYFAIETTRIPTIFLSRAVGGSFMVSSAINAPTGTWPNDNAYHFLFVRYDPALTTAALICAVDGTIIASLTKQANTPNASNPIESLRLGAYGSFGNYFNGGMDDVRLTKVSRSNVVPTAAFPTS